MKRFFPLLLIFFMGCAGQDPDMVEALELRSRCLAAQQIRFQADIGADYITQIEEFSLECTVDAEGTVSFTVREPEEIEGICGSVSGAEGTVEFEDTVLAFPLMADGRLSPLSAPWVLIKALRSGCIVSVGQEGELLHLTIDDSYESDALTVDIWVEDGQVEAAEIAWEGRRQVTMELGEFALTA